MQWRAELLIRNVDIHAELLDKEVHRRWLVTLCCYVQHIHSLWIRRMDIGSQLDQVVEHSQVAVEGGEVDCCEARLALLL